MRECWSEHDVCHGVGCPLHPCLCVPVVASAVVLRQAVAERLCRGHEVLAGVLGQLVAVTMVPPDATVKFYDILLLVVEVCSQHLARIESVVAPAEASSTSAKPSVADIIGRGEAHDARLGVEACAH